LNLALPKARPLEGIKGPSSCSLSVGNNKEKGNKFSWINTKPM